VRAREREKSAQRKATEAKMNKKKKHSRTRTSATSSCRVELKLVTVKPSRSRKLMESSGNGRRSPQKFLSPHDFPLKDPQDSNSLRTTARPVSRGFIESTSVIAIDESINFPNVCWLLFCSKSRRAADWQPRMQFYRASGTYRL
jgi:hypothetical protein